MRFFKDVLTLVVLISISFNSYSQCIYTVRLIDLAGNSSDGSSWWIANNGARYYQYSVPTRANSFKEGYLQSIGASYYDVRIGNVRTIDVYYESVANSNEHAWLVYDDVGRIVDAVNLSVNNNEVTGSSFEAPPSGIDNSRRTVVRCAPKSCQQMFITEAYETEALGSPNLVVDFCTDIQNNMAKSLYIPVQEFCNEEIKIKDRYYTKAQLNNITTIQLRFEQNINGNSVDYTASLQYDYINERILPNSFQSTPDVELSATPARLNGKWYINLAIPENIFLPGPLLTTTTYDYDSGPHPSTTNAEYPNASKTETLYVNKRQIFNVKEQVNISLDAELGCIRQVTLADLLEGYTPCQVGDTNVDELIYTIDFFDLDDQPILDEKGQNIGPFLNQQLSDQTIQFRITDNVTGEQFNGLIVVEDNQTPRLDSIPNGSIPCNHPLFDSLLLGKDEITAQYSALDDNNQPINSINVGAQSEKTIFFDVNICQSLGIDAECLDNSKNILKDIRFTLTDGGSIPTGISLEWPDYGSNIPQTGNVRTNICSPVANYCRKWAVKIKNNTNESFNESIALHISAGYQYHNGFVVNSQTIPGCVISPQESWVSDCSPISIELTSSTFRSTNCSVSNQKGILERTFTITDANGMKTSVTQEITVTRPSLVELNDISFEPVTFYCPDATPTSIRDSITTTPFWSCNVLPTDNQNCDLSVTYSDSDLIPGCNANSGTIVRTWRITDFCNNNSRTFRQDIRLKDQVKPVINGFETTFTNRTDSCSQDMLLTLDASDACGEYNAELRVVYRSYRAVYTRFTVPIVNDSVRVNNLPIRIFGPISFTITVRDGCGNRTTQKFTRTLRDDQPPICNVKDEVVAEIQENGIATVCLSDIDLGTTDNCGLAKTHISPDSCLWDSCMTFTCEDESPATIIYQARDIFGNVCVKRIKVHIVDGNLPEIDDLPNYTVDCDDPRLNDPINSFPFPEARIQCGEAEIMFDSLTRSQDTCNGYFFVRFFTASDQAGNSVQATDTIFVRPSGQNYLVWYPADTSLTDCSGNIQSDVVIELLNKCQSVEVSQRDSTGASDGFCNTIFRIFEIRNPCLLDGVENPDPDLGVQNEDGSFLDDDGFQRYIQQIQIEDNENPVLSGCSSTDTTRLAADENCQIAMNRTVSATDNCEGVSVSFQLFEEDAIVASGDTNSINTTLGLGTFRLVWVATDRCNNTDTCIEHITVRDETAPTCRVINPLTGFWDENGNFTLNIDDIDNGTTDNCGLDSLAIRTLTGSWSSGLDLNCREQVDTILFQAVDQFGNVCSDTIILDIRDTLAPVVDAPNFNVTCNDNRLESPEVFDFPIATDACSDSNIRLLRTESTSTGCGAFQIIRTFEIEDNNPNTPEQVVRDTIFVRDTVTYTVQFPNDTSGIACDVELNAMPIIRNESSCSNVRINVRDTVLTNDPCLTRIRIFEVIDDCRFEAGISDPDKGEEIAPGIFADDDGYQVDTQLIDLIDTIPPTLVACPDTITPSPTTNTQFCVGPFEYTFSANDNCSDLLSYQFQIIHENGDTVFRGATNNINVQLIAGWYDVVQIAFDVCGNADTCVSKVQLIDRQNPQVISANASFNLEDNGSLSLSARDLVFVSDNCTPDDSIEVFFLGSDNESFDSLTFDCSDLGQNSRLVFATDSAGNGGFVLAIFQITDTEGVCNQASPVRISGNIIAANDLPLEAVSINVLGKNQSTRSDVTGAYKLDNLSEGKSYQIELDKEDERLRGLSVIDMVLLQRHLLGMDTLHHLYDSMAADLNMDQAISFTDLFFMQEALMEKELTKNNHVGLWQFADMNQLKLSPTNQFRLERLKTTSIKNFIGFKMGDLDGDSYEGVQSRTNSTLAMRLPNEMVATEWVTVPVRTTRSMTLNGLQLKLAHAASDIAFVSAFEDQEFVWSEASASDKQLNAFVAFPKSVQVDAGEVLFTLRIKANALKKVEELIQLEQGGKSSVVEYKNGTWKTSALELDFEAVDIPKDEPVLYQNRPNPFRGETVISFYLPKSGDANIIVFDAQGRILAKIKESWSKGLHNKTLPNVFREPGVYYYQLQTENFSATRKMVYLK